MSSVVDGQRALEDDDELILYGMGTADVMYGTPGNDLFRVDNEADLIVEAVGGGYDVVYTSVNYTLTAGQEIDEFRVDINLSTLPIKLTGNEFFQRIYGNDGDNRIESGGGGDMLMGRGGNDTFVVTDARDRVYENRGQGRDAVAAGVTYKLEAGQEIEELRVLWAYGERDINLTGNEFGQAIKGNGGANVLIGMGGADTLLGMGGNDTLMGGSGTDTLDGGAGNDTLEGGYNADRMIGGAGNDTYIIDNGDDQVFEATGGGRDTVITRVNYTLTAGQEIELLRTNDAASTLNLKLTGNSLSNAIVGNAGKNQINGAWGNDVLTGGAGADAFYFTNALGSNNVDRITDFAVEDSIRLSSDIFTTLSTGVLAAGTFKNLDTDKGDADDRIMYKQSTGELFYDADGWGGKAMVKFAVVDGNLPLSRLDFYVF